MKELYNSIKGVFKSGGYSFLLLLVVLFFSADSVSIYFLILFGLVQLPLLFARDGSRHIISLLVFSFSYSLIWYMTGTISSIAILMSIDLLFVWFQNRKELRLLKRITNSIIITHYYNVIQCIQCDHT